MTVKYGQVIDGFNTKAVIVRDEKLYRAPVSGKISYFQNEGERLSSGKAVMKISNNNSNRTIYSRKSGILSYNFDKHEDDINPDKMFKLNLNNLNDIKNNYKSNDENEYVNKGEAIFRIINNTNNFLIINIDKKEADRFWINETVFISNVDDNKLFEAKIIDINRRNEKAKITIELKRFIRDWLSIRKKEVQIVKNIYRGIVVPNSAVFPSKNGYQVAIVSPNNDYKSKNINIIFEGEEKMIIEGIDVGENILINPAEENFNRGS